MKQKSTRRGFTLIELLVVVIIIAILAAIALPQYQKAVLKARTAEIQTFIAHVEKAMDLYVLENGYPSHSVSWSEMGIDVSSYCTSTYGDNGSGCEAKYFSAGNSGLSDMWSFYMSPSESTFGPSYINIYFYKDGTKMKECRLQGGSSEAKPLCDALRANDSGWTIYLPS